MKTISHIEAAIYFVRACGPVTKAGIAQEILYQVSGVTPENCNEFASDAIAHGLGAGWIEKYDDESYCLA
jgi:hypothetical protein